MFRAELRVRLWVLIVLFIVVLIVWLPVLSLAHDRQPYGAVLTVHYLDVGQGDATFIETPDGIQVLIDGGPDDSVLRELGRQMGFFDKTIDVIVATHPDKDHIGGLIDVLRRYRVSTVVLTENEGDTPTAATFVAAANMEGAEVIFARAGQQLQLGASTTLAILFPLSDPTEMESNASSIVSQLHFGDIDFIFTGDSPQVIEEFLVEEYGERLESEVLKVGHHGSKTSSAATFVTAVHPDYAIISAGQDNRYGHPHREVLDRFSGTEVMGTYDQGTISITTDGTTVWVE